MFKNPFIFKKDKVRRACDRISEREIEDQQDGSVSKGTYKQVTLDDLSPIPRSHR